MVSAPAWRAAATARLPIGPAPVTRSVLTRRSPARTTAWCETLNGSDRAARRSDTGAGRGHDEASGEAALDVRGVRGRAEIAAGPAQVRSPLEAGLAGPAHLGRVDRDGPAHLEPLDPGPERPDPAHHLVAQRERLGDRELARRA